MKAFFATILRSLKWALTKPFELVWWLMQPGQSDGAEQAAADELADQQAQDAAAEIVFTEAAGLRMAARSLSRGEEADPDHVAPLGADARRFLQGASREELSEVARMSPRKIARFMQTGLAERVEAMDAGLAAPSPIAQRVARVREERARKEAMSDALEAMKARYAPG